MSVTMIGGVPPQLRPRGVAGSPAGQGETEVAAQPRPEVAPAPGAHPASLQVVLPAEVPAGTDPELWQMLTAEERAHFARMSTMGPLTYGRPSRPTDPGEPMLARGGRLDVRA